VLFGFVVLGLVLSVQCQEISWEDRLLNDLFCVHWGIKTRNQSIWAVKRSYLVLGGTL